MASPVSGLFGSPANPAGSTSTTTSITGAAPNEQMFLQLLVAQIQNQDPTNPVDGTQFVSQLAQFSELEQLIAIRGDLDTQNATANGTAPTNTPADTSSPTAASTAPTDNGSTTN
jgi:flagellar basal-body rod modification protein FlgD